MRNRRNFEQINMFKKKPKKMRQVGGDESTNNNHISENAMSFKKSLYGETYLNKCRIKLYPKDDVFVFCFEDANEDNTSKFSTLIDLKTGKQSPCKSDRPVPDKKYAIRKTNKFVFLDTKICFCQSSKVIDIDGYALAVTGLSKSSDDSYDTRPLEIMIDFYETLSNDKFSSERLTLLMAGREDKELLVACLKLAETLEATTFKQALLDAQKLWKK